MTDPLVGAWTFDDRIGVVTQLRLLDVMKQESIIPHFPMMVAFTVGEEVGGLGAKVLAQREQPEIFVSVDGVTVAFQESQRDWVTGEELGELTWRTIEINPDLSEEDFQMP